MPIKIKLKNQEIILGNYNQDVKRSEVDRNSNTLHIFDKLDQNGDKILSVDEMNLANETYSLAVNLENSLEPAFLGSFRSKLNDEIKNKISQINSKNVHAVLAGFQVATSHSNSTKADDNPRHPSKRVARTSPLTLTQAIINYNRIDDNCKKECLYKILDAVVESSKENEKLDEDLRNKYISDLRSHIDQMVFKDDTNADLINALMYELMPNNGCTQGYKVILKEHGYDLSKLTPL